MFCCLLFCMVVGSVVANSLPKGTNIQVSVTKKGLDYANQIFIGSVVSEMEGLKTAGFSKSTFAGTLKLLNPQVNNVVLQSSSIRFEEGRIKVDVSLKTVMVTGKYLYTAGWFGKWNGKFSVKMEIVTVSTSLALSRTKDGKLKLVNHDCNTTIGNSDYKLEGSGSWILKIGVSLLKSYVQNVVEKKICQAIVDTIDKRSATYSSEYAKGFKITQVPCTSSLAYIILEDPVVKEYYCNYMIESKINSACYPPNVSTKQGTKLAPPKTNKMATIAFSDSFINSLLTLYHQAGLMTGTLDIPAKSRGNVSSDIQVTIALTVPPVIRTTVNGSTITIKAKASINSTTLTKKLQSLEGVFDAEGELVFEGRNKSLTGKLTNVGIQSCDSTVKPFIDEINDAQINKAFHATLNEMIVLPFVSTMIMDDPKIVHNQGQTILETDVKM